MGAPVVDQINVVVADVPAATQFLEGLGVEMLWASGEWQHHHRGVPTSTSVDIRHDLDEPEFAIDLDSGAFAHLWGGLSPLFSGVVVNLRTESREEVDRLHERAVELGGVSVSRRPTTPSGAPDTPWSVRPVPWWSA